MAVFRPFSAYRPEKKLAEKVAALPYDVMSSDENVCEEVERKIQSDRARQLVDSALSVRERKIIQLRYGLSGGEPLTQREVAQLLGISRSYVSRIEKGALETLREAMG